MFNIKVDHSNSNSVVQLVYSAVQVCTVAPSRVREYTVTWSMEGSGGYGGRHP